MTRDVLRMAYRKFGVRDWRLKNQFSQTFKEWKAIIEREKLDPERFRDKRDVLIVPPDPLLVTASKGDEAMLKVTIDHIRQTDPSSTIQILSVGSEGDRNSVALGTQPVRVKYSNFVHETFEFLKRTPPKTIYLLGADVMDGYADPNFSIRLLAVVDLAARMGAEARVLGFSCSDEAYKDLADAYQFAHPSIVYCSRDPVSHERFITKMGVNANLVADAAFMLKPSAVNEKTRQYIEWIEAARSGGSFVLGVNFHPLLLPLNQRDKIGEATRTLANDLIDLIEKSNVKVILLAHDFRDEAADVHCHSIIFDIIQERHPDAIFNLSEELPAEDLKSIIASLDATLTGRMHLAIATLGVLVPTMMFSYRGKAEGLFRHFGFDKKYLLPAKDLLEDGVFSARLDEFIAERDELKAQIESKIDDVKALSAANFTA
ncbi:MAG: polysaccharide pyruvyl transferase family protein [Pseudomonadota bacterium]